MYRACTHRVVVVYHAYQCDPWICCAELGSEVCAKQNEDGANPHFAHNIQLVSYLGGGFVCGGLAGKWGGEWLWVLSL